MLLSLLIEVNWSFTITNQNYSISKTNSSAIFLGITVMKNILLKQISIRSVEYLRDHREFSLVKNVSENTWMHTLFLKNQIIFITVKKKNKIQKYVSMAK